MIDIKTDKLVELIKEEFKSMKKCSYIESSTVFLGQIDGIEFTITLCRDEDEFMEDGVYKKNAIITKP